MIYIVQNIVPILAAALAGLLIGWLYRGVIRAAPAPGLLPVAVAAQFWFAAILAGAIILAPAGRAGPWTMALGSAFIIWIGFVLPVLLISHVHRGLGLRAGLADSAYWLLVMLAQAAVMRAIGVSAPPV